MASQLSFSRPFRVLIAGLIAGSALHARAVTLAYTENFQNPANSADAAASYPAFTTALNGGSAVVTNGVLTMSANTESDQIFTVSISPAASGEITIFGQVGAGNSNGSYNVGMVVGENRIVFHPGFVAGGAFRVEGPNGFGNTNMGYVPANGLLHQFEIHSFPSGLFTIKVTDAANPANVFTTSFTNPASYGGAIGFVRSGPAGGGATGIFDNLVIVPEPSTAGLFALGALWAGRRRRSAR